MYPNSNVAVKYNINSLLFQRETDKIIMQFFIPYNDGPSKKYSKDFSPLKSSYKNKQTPIMKKTRSTAKVSRSQTPIQKNYRKSQDTNRSNISNIKPSRIEYRNGFGIGDSMLV